MSIESLPLTRKGMRSREIYYDKMWNFSVSRYIKVLQKGKNVTFLSKEIKK